MTHNWLFTLYAALLLLTVSFYDRPTLVKAASIGAVCGLMALTRPTDILAVLLPVLWGLSLTRTAVQARLVFWQKHWAKLLAAVLLCGAVGSIQPLYWHYVTGRWLVYSYQDQGFSWLHPHLWDGTFSYKSGWLLYSPLLVLAVVGFGPLRRRQPQAFWALLIFTLVFIYVTFAWDIWWYGGSLGARAMVQAYAVLAWPLAAALEWVLARRRWTAAFAVFLVVGIYYNLWLTHQAHRGSLYVAGEMTKEYFWRVVGRWDAPVQARWLLDNGDQVLPDVERKNVRELWRSDFEQGKDHDIGCDGPPIEGQCSLAVDPAHPRTPEFKVPVRQQEVQWVRVRAKAQSTEPETHSWTMTQLLVSFCHGDTKVKERVIRLHRVLRPGAPAEVYLDLHAPRKKEYDNVRFSFRNAGSSQRILVDDLRVEAFDK